MQRREFVSTVAGATVGALAAPRLELARKLPTTNWTWVHGGREWHANRWSNWFTNVAEAGINGVLVSGDNAQTISPIARDAGLSYHRWIWILNRNGDDWAQQNHPEWFTVNRNGESSLTHPQYVDYYKWICPTRDPVREYLRDIVGEAAGNPDVEGINLDYIRHADVILPVGLWERYGIVQDREYPQYDYCYCDVCRSRFHDEFGRDPMGIADAPADPEWKQFRWDSITRLVNELAEVVHRQGKPITADVFPTPAMARLMVHQDWDKWNLDAVFPMIYHTFYNRPIDWIESTTGEGVRNLAGRRSLYSGLYLPALAPGELGAAVQAAIWGGAQGVSLFEMEGLTHEHLGVLQSVLAE